VVLVGGRALQLAPSYGVSPEPWQQASAYVLDRARPGDCVAFYPLDGRMAFQYYLGTRPSADRLAPRSILPVLPWGEVHPDGDEFLYVVSGAMELILDDGDETRVGVETKVLLGPGDAYLVPRGIWHRLEAVEPSYLIHVTPGPSGGHRPRRDKA